MTTIQLPRNILSLRVIRLLDWSPTVIPEPNPTLLNDLNKRRIKQSKTSRERQAFITGLAIYRLTAEEFDAKMRYIEEWHHRIKENGEVG